MDNVAHVASPRSLASVQTQSPARDSGRSPRSALKRLVYAVWRHTPAFVQRLAVRLAVPRASLGVCAVIRDGGNRVLLAHHTYGERAWRPPAGFMRKHEDPKDTIAREIEEELGVSAVVGRLIDAELDTVRNHLTLYYEVIIQGAPTCDGVEIDELRYVSPAEVTLLFGAPQPWLGGVAAA